MEKIPTFVSKLLKTSQKKPRHAQVDFSFNSFHCPVVWNVPSGLLSSTSLPLFRLTTNVNVLNSACDGEQRLSLSSTLNRRATWQQPHRHKTTSLWTKHLYLVWLMLSEKIQTPSFVIFANLWHWVLTWLSFLTLRHIQADSQRIDG